MDRHRYGLSTRSWPLWLRDIAVSTAIDTVLTAFGVERASAPAWPTT